MQKNKRFKPIRVLKISPEQVLCFAGSGTKEFVGTDPEGDKQTYTARMNSLRFFVFKRSRRCVCCGLYGTLMILEFNSSTAGSPHFNLYGVVNRRYVLMTKDHKQPKSKGGKDHLENLQCMCTICNKAKKNHDITLRDLRLKPAIADWIRLVKKEKACRRKRKLRRQHPSNKS